MRQLLLSCSLFLLLCTSLAAQNGCPGCTVDVPAGLPADTLYLPALPNGQVGAAYDEDISFRVPKTTTPVYAVDSITPPGLTITKIEIVSIQGLPPGLFWQANQTVFETATQTDGCIKICGTPTQSDTFVLTVKLKASIFIFTQEATFPMRLYVAPKVSATDGFELANFVGCGATTVSFTNKIPSGGHPGITYEWDLGDGTTSTEENPPPHTYTMPGIYPVTYHATIDTAGYILTSATVLSADCTDLFSAGPDVYLIVKGPNNQVLYNSSPEVSNATFPLAFPLNLSIDPQSNYTLELWDEDSGLEGSDDACGAISFNILSGDTLVSGGFTVALNIDHPIDEVFAQDTVIVYPQPANPVIQANTLKACQGDPVVLESSYGAGNQWWQNGQPIFGATDFLFAPDESSYYQVQVLNGNGCNAISDSVWVEFYAPPAVPAWVNDRNNLEVKDTTAVPDTYSLQWYLFAAPIPGATGFTYCASQSGEYTLVLVDLETGCASNFAATITYDPAFDCTLGAYEPGTQVLNIFPNPAREIVTVQLKEALTEQGNLLVWDLTGRLLHEQAVEQGALQTLFDSTKLEAGAYILELRAGEQHFLGRLAVLR